jgi:hypothetical protein
MPDRRHYLKITVEISAAVVDRLTFAGQIIQTGTVSYRLAHARQQQNAKKAASAPAR